MEGITPYDFVQRVYYAQEKVLLDFQPTDDKYKEVITEGNTVVREFQDEEDWSFLRDRITLGDLHPVRGQEIPEFALPDWCLKVSTLHGDGVRLHKVHHGIPSEHDFIYVPYGSKGVSSYRDYKVYNQFGLPDVPDHDLHAISIGKTVTFNRKLMPHEWVHRVATTDIQRAVELFDRNKWEDADYHMNHIMWTEIPNVEYIIAKTAAYHSYGSPVASGRAMDLIDQAQKLLSSMRDNDSAKTSPDQIYSPPLHYISV